MTDWQCTSARFRHGRALLIYVQVAPRLDLDYALLVNPMPAILARRVAQCEARHEVSASMVIDDVRVDLHRFPVDGSVPQHREGHRLHVISR